MFSRHLYTNNLEFFTTVYRYQELPEEENSSVNHRVEKCVIEVPIDNPRQDVGPYSVPRNFCGCEIGAQGLIVDAKWVR